MAKFVPNVTKVQGSSLWGNLWCKYRPCGETFGKPLVQVSSLWGRYLQQRFPHRDDPYTFVMFGTKHTTWSNFRDDLCNLLLFLIRIIYIEMYKWCYQLSNGSCVKLIFKFLSKFLFYPNFGTNKRWNIIAIPLQLTSNYFQVAECLNFSG